jgi:hypothetical protein
LIVMDIGTQSCSVERRPRCVAALPAVQKLLAEARAKGVLVLYTLAGASKRTDIVKEVAPLEAEQSLGGAGPDKFVGSDLDAILKAKNIKTLITVEPRRKERCCIRPRAPHSEDTRWWFRSTACRRRTSMPSNTPLGIWPTLRASPIASS